MKIPADVFDTLEMIAMENGGVGHGIRFWYSSEPINTLSEQVESYFTGYDTPHCIIGIANYAGISAGYDALQEFGIDYIRNDRIVRAYRTSYGVEKMPWDEYIKAYPLERGE